MKREIKSENNVRIKVPAPSKAIDKEFQSILSSMIKKMSDRFKNQTFKKLNKSTINKFEDNISFNDDNISFSYIDEELSISMDVIKYKFTDHKSCCGNRISLDFHNTKEHYVFSDAQTGNYATVFLKLSKNARKSILKQFSDERIDKMVKDVLGKVDNQNRDKFYSRLESKIGISSKELVATEGLRANTNALMIETKVWAEKLRDEALESFVSNSIRGMSMGLGLDEVIDQFEVLTNERVTRAKTVARTQVSTFNSLLSKARAQNLGIQKAIWVTSNDERVRPSHEARQGKEFDLDKGLYSSVDGKWLLPGVDYNCRCDYEMIIPED